MSKLKVNQNIISYLIIVLFLIGFITFLIVYQQFLTNKKETINIQYTNLNTPVILMDAMVETNSIRLSVNVATLTSQVKIKKYEITIGHDQFNFTVAKKEIETNKSILEEVIFDGLEPNTAYYIKVVLILEDDSQYEKISNMQMTPESQSSLNNDSIPYFYRRDRNNNGQMKVKNDMIPPNIAKISMPGIVYEDQEFDVTVVHQDSLSGINIAECKYIFSTQKVIYTASSPQWKNAEKFSSNNQVIRLKAETKGTYYLHILSKDMFKNWRETVKTIKVVENLGEGTRNKKESKWNIPYVPSNFDYQEGSVASGYVIKDQSGNEFVWIPVDGNQVKLERNSFNNYYYKSFQNYQETLDTLIVKSVKQYGGYYIARYEAGIGSNGSLVSQKDATVMTYITIEKAIEKANQMYASKEIKSILMNSYFYDTAISWIEKSHIEISDSTNYGNYQENGEKEQTCGKNAQWQVNHIYDLAGNCWELTTETFLNDSFVRRGGAFNTSGTKATISYRDSCSKEFVSNDTGFRVAFYIT